MSKNFKRVISVLITAMVIVLVALIIMINITFKKDTPIFVKTDTDERVWTLVPETEYDMIQANYWAYVRKAYVLVGEAPNYEYYKIASGVPRNDYEPDNFFIEDSDNLMYYHNSDSTAVSKVAVDVSSYQTDVDWDAIKRAGVDMAIIRAGYRGYGTGNIVTDDMFESHIEGALEAGLEVGVYFFTQAVNYDEGVEEAKYTLNLIRGYNVRGPVVIDTEIVYAEGARTEGLDIDARTDSIVGFCETVKAAGYEPMVYSNRNWFVQELDMARVGNYKLWLAHYANQPDFPYLYTVWQYTSEGRLSGNGVDLDLNVILE